MPLKNERLEPFSSSERGAGGRNKVGTYKPRDDNAAIDLNDVEFLECYNCNAIVCPKAQRFCSSCLEPLQGTRRVQANASTGRSPDGSNEKREPSTGSAGITSNEEKDQEGSSPSFRNETFYVGEIAYFCNKGYQEVTKGRIVQFMCDVDPSSRIDFDDFDTNVHTNTGKRVGFDEFSSPRPRNNRGNGSSSSRGNGSITNYKNSAPTMSVRMRYFDPTWAFDRYDEIHPLTSISRDIDGLSASIGKRARTMRRVLDPSITSSYFYGVASVDISKEDSVPDSALTAADAAVVMPTKRARRTIHPKSGDDKQTAEIEVRNTNSPSESASKVTADKQTNEKEKETASATRTLPRRLSAFKLPRRIHALFHSGGDPSRFKQANIEVLSSDPPVYKIKKFLTKEELSFFSDFCSKNCSSFEHSFTENESGDAVISEERTSTYKWFGKAASKSVCLIEKKAADFVGLSVDHVEPLQVVYYTEGQLFGEHHDAGETSFDVFLS
jgi:hypothetical protein